MERDTWRAIRGFARARAGRAARVVVVEPALRGDAPLVHGCLSLWEEHSGLSSLNRMYVYG